LASKLPHKLEVVKRLGENPIKASQRKQSDEEELGEVLSVSMVSDATDAVETNDKGLCEVTITAPSALLNDVPGAMCSQWQEEDTNHTAFVKRLCANVKTAKGLKKKPILEVKSTISSKGIVNDKSESKKEPCPATCTSSRGTPGSKQCNFGAWWKQHVKTKPVSERECPDGGIGVGGVFVDDVNKGGMCISWDETARGQGMWTKQEQHNCVMRSGEIAPPCPGPGETFHGKRYEKSDRRTKLHSMKSAQFEEDQSKYKAEYEAHNKVTARLTKEQGQIDPNVMVQRNFSYTFPANVNEETHKHNLQLYFAGNASTETIVHYIIRMRSEVELTKELAMLDKVTLTHFSELSHTTF